MGIALCICVTLGKGMLRTYPFFRVQTYMPRPTCSGSSDPWCWQTRQQPNTPGSDWGTPSKQKGPKAGVLGSHPLGGGSPFQATPRFFDDKHVRPKNLTKLPHLHRCHANLARCPVLNVLGKCLKVRHGHVAQGILVEFVVKCLAGGHPLWRRR
jgi:hypothetical protein